MVVLQKIALTDVGSLLQDAGACPPARLSLGVRALLVPILLLPFAFTRVLLALAASFARQGMSSPASRPPSTVRR